MSNKSFLKKIEIWSAAKKKAIHEWIVNGKKHQNNKKSGTFNNKSVEWGQIFSTILWRLLKGGRIVLALFVIVILVVIVIKLKNCSGWGKWESDTIERKTSFVVAEINKISEFTTIAYYEEQLIEKKKQDSYMFGFISSEKLLSVVVNGTIRAGIDLSTVSEDDVTIVEDGVLKIRLPRAKILETIINPTDVDIVYGGNNNLFNDDDYKDVINQAEDQLKDHAMAEGILTKAENQGKKELENLFEVLGYKVDITFKE